LGKYAIYYSKKASKVFLIENDLGSIENSKIIQTINVPSVISNVKIFATKNRLILI
jgi:hypothetical protein